MRPVKLSFGGLNSYREPALVDFELLGRGGVFGIFGPTGSGKSTILDAITLALYSKVDRAPNNTRGVINLSETDAWVSFSFLLGGETYSVERKFSRHRDDPHSARATSARLTKGEREVLADRPTTVTTKVQELLGLDASEFSRAVALPQGKFDEFLKLAGVERADMLGRIFDLERFGEPLYVKASSRRNQWKSVSGKLEASQETLGDVSDGARLALEEQLALHRDELEKTKELEKDTQTRFLEAREVLGLQTRLAEAQATKGVLMSRESQVRGWEEAILLGRRANPLGPSIDQIEEQERAYKKTYSDLREARPRLRAASSQLASAKVKEATARDKANLELPILYFDVAKMKDAVSLSDELGEKETRHKTLSKTASDLKRKLGIIRAKEAAAEVSLGEHEAQVQRLSQREGELRVDPEERKRNASLLSALEKLDTARKDAQRAKGGLEKKESASEESRRALVGIYGEIGELSARRLTFAPGSSKPLVVTGHVPPIELRPGWTGAEVLEAAALEVEESKKLVLSLRTFAEAAYTSDQAAVLARGLTGGDPCPVCGSTHHPSPAEGSAAGHEAAKKCLDEATTCSDLVSLWRDRLGKAVTDWDAKKMLELAAWEEHEQKKGAFEEQTKALLEALESDPLDTRVMDEAALSIRKKQVEIAKKDKEQPSVLSKLSSTRVLVERARGDLEEARGQKGTLTQEQGVNEAELRALTEQIEGVRAKISLATGGVDPAVGLDRAKLAIEDLQAALSSATDQVQSLQEKVNAHREAVVALESRLEQTKEGLSSERQSLERALGLAGFLTVKEARGAMLSPDKVADLEKRVSRHKEECSRVQGEIGTFERELRGRTTSQDQCKALEDELDKLSHAADSVQRLIGETEAGLRDLSDRRQKWETLEQERTIAEGKRDVADRLASLLRGRALVRFLSEEHLRDMAADASGQLGTLTSHRFALEYKDGDFQMRDDYSGGQRRPTGTLSGGETFLTSLALALALSGRIQLRGQYPLGFFFLDEGFGTLDGDRLEAVVTALESLRKGERLVGVISHVKELRERLPYYLDVLPPTSDGRGSRIVMGSG